MRLPYNIRNLALLLVVFSCCVVGWSGEGMGTPRESRQHEEIRKEHTGQEKSLQTDSQKAPDKSAQSSAPSASNQGQPKDSGFALPIVPFILEYENAQKYLVQKINTNPDYLGIEAIIQSGTPEVYQVSLIEKESRRKVYYTNSEVRAKFLMASGKVAHVTQIAYKAEEELGDRPKNTLSFKDEKGRLIRWIFTQAGDLDEVTKGVAFISRPLKIMYRNTASMAGEGTTVQIGEMIEPAKERPDLSVPPYYLVYEGTLCVDAILGGMVSGNQTWQATASPRTIETGAEWVLTDERGNKRQLKVIAKRGQEITLQDFGTDPLISAPMKLGMKETPEGLALTSVSFSDEQRIWRLTFLPDLNLAEAWQAGKKIVVSFHIDVGSEHHALEGVMEVERKGDVLELTGRPSAPEWAKPLILKSKLTLSKTGYKLESDKAAPAN
jgi:hypothetical protein